MQYEKSERKYVQVFIFYFYFNIIFVRVGSMANRPATRIQSLDGSTFCLVLLFLLGLLIIIDFNRSIRRGSQVIIAGVGGGASFYSRVHCTDELAEWMLLWQLLSQVPR